MQGFCHFALQQWTWKTAVSGVRHLQPCAKRSQGKAEVLWVSVGAQQHWTRGFPSWLVDWQSWTPAKQRSDEWKPVRGHGGHFYISFLIFFSSPADLWRQRHKLLQGVPTQCCRELRLLNKNQFLYYCLYSLFTSSLPPHSLITACAGHFHFAWFYFSWLYILVELFIMRTKNKHNTFKPPSHPQNDNPLCWFSNNGTALTVTPCDPNIFHDSLCSCFRKTHKDFSRATSTPKLSQLHLTYHNKLTVTTYKANHTAFVKIQRTKTLSQQPWEASASVTALSISRYGSPRLISTEPSVSQNNTSAHNFKKMLEMLCWLKYS